MKNGFTLIELLVTIGIVSILMGLGVPGYQNLVMNNHLDMRQSVLMQSLLLARSEAVERKRRVTICASPDPFKNNPACSNNAWGTGWVVFEDDSAGTIGTFQSANDTVLERFAPKNTSVAVVAPAVIQRSITFLPDGTVDGSSFTSTSITMRDSREANDCGTKTTGRRCVKITSTGRARTE